METRRYPVDTQTFSKVIEGNYVYVDKTALVYKMVKSFNYVFLSRPRRFGKSLLCSTLKEYFEGNKEMFAGLQMAELEKDWVKYPVIHLDFSDNKSNDIDSIKESISAKLDEYEKFFNITDILKGFGFRFSNIITAANKISGQKAVVIIDEYDAIMLNAIGNDKLYNQICAMMTDLLSPLKQLDPYLRFVFITGTTTFPQMTFSLVLNNICNISLKPEYETICGISENELYTQLKDGIQDFADKNNLTFEQTLQMFKDRYGGYHFTRQMQDVFNPFSVISALSSKILNDYWLNSETQSLLPDLMTQFDFEMEDFEKIDCSESRFNQPVEQVDDLVPYLYQFGYLTIKNYRLYIMETNIMEFYTLGYPNGEVRTAINFYSTERNIESYKAEEEKL